jgi:hypothetical protein
MSRTLAIACALALTLLACALVHYATSSAMPPELFSVRERLLAATLLLVAGAVFLCGMAIGNHEK